MNSVVVEAETWVNGAPNPEPSGVEKAEPKELLVVAELTGIRQSLDQLVLAVRELAQAQNLDTPEQRWREQKPVIIAQANKILVELEHYQSHPFDYIEVDDEKLSAIISFLEKLQTRILICFKTKVSDYLYTANQLRLIMKLSDLINEAPDEIESARETGFVNKFIEIMSMAISLVDDVIKLINAE